VIGDSCLDKFIYGTCDRLSPEAPVPVLKHVSTEEMPGMAGNVAKNIKAFSDNITLLTQKRRIEKIRYVDSKSNQHIMRFDIEPPYDTSDVFLAKKCPTAEASFSGNYDIVILSDYDKGFLQRAHVLEFTSKMNQKIYVDSKKKDISCFTNSIIKLNDKEYRKSGHTVCNSSTLVKTMGRRGASHAGCIYPSQPVEVFDVSGAGDTFLASFAVYHAVTGDMVSAIKFANKCASIVIQRKGTYALNKGDLK
jgi:D-beta-D-heptose 7-phosphate kinase/D-beta-D-heptose 1-phosphate adenosyltransferase